MKKIIVTVIAVIIALFAGYFVGSGFVKRHDVMLHDFSVSEDGAEMTFHVLVPTSMGYIRGFSDSGGGVKPHYLTFYSTFGGINSSFGAKSEFVLKLDKDDSEIYFKRLDGYELVYYKNKETGEWEKA